VTAGTSVHSLVRGGGVAAILEKACCEHVKTLAQAEAVFSVDDTKDPSTEASSIGGNFFHCYLGKWRPRDGP
jgi:hypothetical protein